MECCMHVAGSTTPIIIQFSAESWATFVKSSLEWVSFNTKESQIAAIAIEKYDLKENVFPSVPANVGYHRECYMQYANRRNIERARKRKERAIQQIQGLYNIVILTLDSTFNLNFHIINIIHNTVLDKYSDPLVQ